MDFFEAQDRARRRSGRLVILFILALLGTVAALYVAAIFIAKLASGDLDRPASWWQPELFLGVAVLTLLVSGIASLTRWLALRAGGPAVAERVGGRRVSPDTTDIRERTLFNVVEEMSLASGVPVPAVYVLPGEPGINAFAAGYSPADAAVAVTEGALERLSRDELQGVIAHEFSHILNGDMRLNTRLSALVFGILALSILGRGVLRAFGRVRVSGSSRRGKNDGGGAVLIAILAAGFALLVIGYIGHLFGKLVQAAVSRQREFLADSAAVQFTRNPAGIAGALKKLGGLSVGGRMDVSTAGEISHFCFAQNFRSDFGDLFATHPDLATRIRAIEPGWDGKFTAPAVISRPEHKPAAPSAPSSAARANMLAAFGGPAAAHLDAAVLLGASGDLSPATMRAGQAFHSAIPEPLRDAAHDPRRVSALCFTLCLPHDGTPLEPLLALIAKRSTPADARLAEDLHAQVVALPAALRLPLLQLATPALRQLEPGASATLLDTLDALVHADGRVTPHEFALQKILHRTLGLASSPRDALRVLAPNQVANELSLALSVAARAEAADETAAAQAFARAAVQFNGLQPPLAYRPAGPSDIDELDLALEHLAHTPAPFRKRILQAFATAFAADQKLTQTEADLLRAFAAALDCPLPPVLPVSA